MRIIKAKDYLDMSRKAANIISAQIIMKPDCVLGLATGSSVIGIYEKLSKWYVKGDLDFSKITSVNLDEYKGISKENKQSYYYFMNEKLFSKVNMNPNQTFLPDGMESDSDKVCKAYDKIIEKCQGIDLQLLGLGHNGHIGFNEPNEVFEAVTHCVDLTDSTINANKRFFNNIDEVPKQAYTMGIKTIMQANEIVVVVSGADKAVILQQAFFGPITPKVQASILQLHKNVIVVADEAALSLIESHSNKM
ncbi:glucosamine-6-phosphate deaminase [Lachnotalea glycerini]|uniref:Glucosamine-6-phosphate deaminase n=1 Tax=Lachnotalea glycerini TaxID=1763509 RepID=A0A371JDS5_9FIRM|nr:glucosamine-6-phosphate deaminase [Lachnotalea glycerini]RDY30921.1 glucosamine-6-phosphate deaminase [Lachnotalea glycerini]